MFAKQQRRETRAVDKQITFDITVLFAVERRDVAVIRRIDPGDVIQNVLHPKHFGAVFLQHLRELAGIEMVAVVHDGGILRCAALLGRQATLTDVALHG